MDEVLLRRLLGAGALLTVALLFSALLPEPGAHGRDDGVVAYDLRTHRQIGAPPPVENPPELKADETLAMRPAATGTEPPPAVVADPAPRPSLKVDEKLSAGAGGWSVQVASFSNVGNARGAAQQLFGMGLTTQIQTVSMGQAQWYRVRVGPYASERAALEALARVRKGGYKDAKLVRPDAAAKQN